ncbi:MAG: hypothetical protein GAK28_00597 [Luteibacter sp.]|uniref:hypothetical protein n=1 Tax=Luteibacter sp. TaxID=1886636 RepID=UPI001380BFE8|nr:hypothetical protein [Luteibacter sp.]KAF1008965.1 MAG: hypothetical protein GAK28_00597 [Luteibacter sp.]
MSVERDAEEKLESLIRKMSREGNVVPFPRHEGAKRKGEAAQVLSLTGNGSAAVIGSNNQISINVVKTTRKVVAEVKPGAVHISDREAATLKEMVADICTKSGKSHQFVWNQLLRHMVVPQYRLIPAAAYPDAIAYLSKWLARLSPTYENEESEATRKRHLAYIKITQKKKGMADSLIVSFVKEVLKKPGLRECSNKDLEYVRVLVKTWSGPK